MSESASNPFDQLTEALGLREMPPEDQERTLLELHELIIRGTFVRLMERMDEATRADFTALLEREAPEADLEAFLAERVPGADAAVEETISQLTSDILAVTTK